MSQVRSELYGENINVKNNEQFELASILSRKNKKGRLLNLFGSKLEKKKVVFGGVDRMGLSRPEDGDGTDKSGKRNSKLLLVKLPESLIKKDMANQFLKQQIEQEDE